MLTGGQRLVNVATLSESKPRHSARRKFRKSHEILREEEPSHNNHLNNQLRLKRWKWMHSILERSFLEVIARKTSKRSLNLIRRSKERRDGRIIAPITYLACSKEWIQFRRHNPSHSKDTCLKSGKNQWLQFSLSTHRKIIKPRERNTLKVFHQVRNQPT